MNNKGSRKGTFLITILCTKHGTVLYNKEV